MPISKSSTSIDHTYRLLIMEKADRHHYKWLLDELLALIHRDGGQYTALSGYAVSVEDAICSIHALHRIRLKHDST